MSSGERISLAQAEQLAAELLEDFTPYCERIAVVGSIRRRRLTIGDLEILAVPVLLRETDLFGEYTGEAVSLLDDRCRHLLTTGELQHRPDKNGHNAFGSRYKRLSYRGVGLDLFCVLQPAQWGLLSIIRTGSADFSHRLVTPIEQGGWMPAGMICRDGSLWCLRTGQALPTPDEASVFAAIGRPYVEPWDREVAP